MNVLFPKMQLLKPLTLLIVLCFVFSQSKTFAQNADSILQNATVDRIINYALANQTAIKQASINQEITDLQIRNKLADWFPQLNFNYNLQHNFELPINNIGGNPIRFGVFNTSALQLTASQNIFSRDALLAAQTKSDVKLLAAKQTQNIKINLVANVYKNFYDLLATEQQRKITDQNIVMLSRSLKDAQARFNAGITDKTDYQRATIALNNAIASKREIEEAVIIKTENLKYLINYPNLKPFSVQMDSTLLEQEIYIDSLHTADFSNRIEYQQLQTQLRLQQANVRYNKWSYLPTVAANGAYIRSFMNDNFTNLYRSSFPNSYAGLTLGFPIFQGGKRKNNISISEKQVSQTALDIVAFLSQANMEFKTAMARYRAAMANYQALKENLDMAKEVNRIIELQYREGIKTYLELITAQTDLRAAQINYFNAVYNLLSSKVDVQKAEGAILVN